MAGQMAAYQGSLPSNVLKVVGIDLVAAGDIDAEGKLTAVVRADPAKKIYRKLVIRDNLLVGAILLGDRHSHATQREGGDRWAGRAEPLKAHARMWHPTPEYTPAGPFRTGLSKLL